MTQSFFRDKHGQIVLWQSPNLALYGWAFFALLKYFTQLPKLGWISTAFLLGWALMEVLQGVNSFRRAIGLIVLALTAAPLFR